MLASTQGECATSDEGHPENFSTQEVGNNGYLVRHNTQMFEEGRSFSGNERDCLWWNNGDGTWFNISDLSGCDSLGDGRGALACDFDGDGDLDLFVHELQRERHALYRNELENRYGSFLKLRLVATSGNPEAIGATVTVTTEDGVSALPMSRGAGYLSCAPPELIFGLGPDADDATVRVRWPGGHVDEYQVAANQNYVLTEAGEAKTFEAPRGLLPDPLPAGLFVREGDVVPALTVQDESGKVTTLDPVALADGGTLYLNFWASYCGPCVQELPLLEKKHQKDGANVVTLSMDAPADQARSYELLKQSAASFPGFVVSTEEGQGAPLSSVVDLERLPIPTTLVLDAEGRITQVIRGILREDD